MLNYLSNLDSKLSSFSFGSKPNSDKSFSKSGWTKFESESRMMEVKSFAIMIFGTLAVVLLPFFLFKMIRKCLFGNDSPSPYLSTGLRAFPLERSEDPKDIAAENFKEIVNSSAPKYKSDGQRGIYRDNDDLARNMLIASSLIASSSHDSDHHTSNDDSYTPSSHDSQIYSTPTYHTPDTSSWSGGGFDGGGSTGSW